MLYSQVMNFDKSTESRMRCWPDHDTEKTFFKVAEVPLRQSDSKRAQDLPENPETKVLL